MEVQATRNTGLLKTHELITANDIEPKKISAGFERLYIALRKKEQRLCSDEEVLQLPLIPASHPHHKEWKIRAASADKLFRFLQKKRKLLTILEVGCGNGWLSAKLAQLNNADITGTDINETELSQAKRVFSNVRSIHFLNKDVRDEYFDGMKFDVIIFAAAVQYFPSFEEIINRSLSLLKPAGEVHIIDSFFYADQELGKAKERSASYFEQLGFSGMNEMYFHHSRNALIRFNHRFLYRPETALNRLVSRNNIFPWISIKNK